MSSDVQRQTAVRAFADEFADATHTFKEGDSDMAPKFALLPTGLRANRVFAVGTLTETEDVGSDGEYWKGRIIDPTGTFFVYAGQYQPDAAAFLREVETPKYVSVVGKANTFGEDDDDEPTNVALRPEHITVVDSDTRDTWLIETANQTLDRIEEFETTDLDSDMAPPDLLKANNVYNPDVANYRAAVEEVVNDLQIDT